MLLQCSLLSRNLYKMPPVRYLGGGRLAWAFAISLALLGDAKQATGEGKMVPLKPD